MTEQTANQAVKDEIAEEKLDSVSGGALRAQIDPVVRKQQAALGVAAPQPALTRRLDVP